MFTRESEEVKLQKIMTKNWYAICVKPRHDAKVYLRLLEKNIECIFATYNSTRQWKDRKKKIALPLFPGYLFVKADLKSERVKILETDGVGRFIQFAKGPEKIPENEIEMIIKTQTCEKLDLKPIAFKNYEAGTKVTILDGPFEGYKGIIDTNLEGKRFIVKIDSLMQAFSINVENFLLKFEI
ncbi:UpxY family transcription antiterminator [bacterium]|nr:UpxY family transcription antiterminator [bacterium]